MRFDLKNVGRALKAATAAVVATATLAAPAWAGIGSGGGGVSASGGIGPSSDILYLHDNITTENPDQGWGQDSINYAIGQIEGSVGKLMSKAHQGVVNACNQAITNAINDKSDGPATKARVIGVAATIQPYQSAYGDVTTWGTNTNDFRNRFEKNWAYAEGQLHSLIGYDGNWVNRVHDQFNNQISQTGAQYPTGVAIVCVAVNDYQPPRNYNLTVTTNQQDGASVKVGSTKPVHDLIHAGNDRGTAENLNATVELHFDGNEWVGAKTVSKGATITSQGDTNSPNFTPSDFGWQIWENGKYWFDVKVAKQGKMANSVDTNDRDAAETWDVPPYTLNIKTDQQNGDKTLVGGTKPLHDVVHASHDGDPGYKTDVNADFTLNFDGNDWTKATSKTKTIPITNNGDTNGPEFTPNDLGMTYWESGTYWWDVKVAKQKNMKDAVDTPDREPSESFTIKPYTLTIATEQQTPKAMKVGNTSPVKDTIIASHDGDPDFHANVEAKITLHYDGQPNGYVAATQAEKTFSIDNNGKTDSPEFTPSDLGMKHWQEGNYWFDIRVERQKDMAGAVDTEDHQASESFTVSAVPPEPPVKKIEDGVSADQMDNLTKITTGTGAGGYEVKFVDTINPNGIDYSISDMKVTDLTDKTDVSGQFTMTWDQAKNTVTAVRTPDKGEMPIDHDWEFSFQVKVTKPTDFKKVDDQAKVKWNQQPEASTGKKTFPTWQPKPDKSWIKWDKDLNRWAAVIDPEHTNKTGADAQTYLDGDRIASVVNGTVSQNLIDVPTKFILSDDWAKADYIFSPDGKDQIRVYEATAATDRKTSVQDIVNKGKDVTDQFDITLNGTVATASAKPEYLKSMQGLKDPKQVTLLVPGKVDFANGKGSDQVLQDFGKKQGDELTFCASPDASKNPADVTLTNAGYEQLNGHKIDTNEPNICGYIPPVVKQVLGESSQGGAQEDIDGKKVHPGEKVEYKLTTEPTMPPDLGYAVENVQFADTFDPQLTPDKQTVEVTDLVNGDIVPKSKYTTKWDDKNHKFTLTVTDKTLLAQWQASGQPRIMVRFEGTVSDKVPDEYDLRNQWTLVLNHSETHSNWVDTPTPGHTPQKEDMQSEEQGDPTVSIDGKTMLLGDTGNYVVTLDLTQEANSAYKVWRAGITDDYDQEYVSIDAKDITVMDAKGKDVTNMFNIQVKDGVAYVYAKTVDTEIPATGETVKGDPQPTDLKAYSESDDYKPLEDPAIDQSLLGQKLKVIMPYKVIKVTDGYVVKNTATQVTNKKRDKTNQVSNPLKPLNPAKDVTVKVNGESKDQGTISKDSVFLYRLDSTVLPKNRAYETVTDWQIVDHYDTKHDEPTGQWAVYAQSDVKDKTGKVVAKKGDRIAGSQFTREDDPNGQDQWFTYEQGKDGTFTITATPAFLTLISANVTDDQQWTAWVQCKRTHYSDRVENKFTETLNKHEQESNVVWTKTPKGKPAIDVEKFDTKSGPQQGDRDEEKQALTVSGDTNITFRITNTGDTPLGKITLKDALVAGSGEVKDLKYPDGWDTLVLQPGQSVDVTGTLTGVNDTHTDKADVTGTQIVECPLVDENPFDGGEPMPAEGPCYGDTVADSDPWNGKKPLAQTGVAGVSLIVLLAFSMMGAGLMLRRRKTSVGRHAM